MSEKAIKEAQNSQEVRKALPSPAEIWTAAVRAVRKNSTVQIPLLTQAQLLAQKAWDEGISYDNLDSWMECTTAKAGKDK